MDEQPPKPTRTRAPRARRPRTTTAAAVEVTEPISAAAGAAPDDALLAAPAAAVAADDGAAAAPAAAQPAAPELSAIEDEDDVTEPGAPATRKAGKSDLRALGEALAADPALRHAVFGADDPIEASDAWLRAARGVRLRKRQRAALAKAWSRAGALFVAAAGGELGHWLHRR